MKSFKGGWEIIVVDNASQDKTAEYIKSLKLKNLKLIENKENLGYSKANNQGAQKAKGKHLLFLNPDVKIEKVNFLKLIKFLEKSKKRAGLTVKLVRENGELDMACHRGFPTLWRSFCYFAKLERVASKLPFKFLKKLFGGYHLLHKDFSKIHKIDSPSGAFFLIKKQVFEEVGGFDEEFFMYGEDLDLSFRIVKAGYSIFFYPKYRAVHFKYKSGLSGKDRKIRRLARYHFYNAMKIFFKKHYLKTTPRILSFLVLKALDFKISQHKL